MLKCGLNENGICLLLNTQMTENCRCPYYRTNVEHCDICGQVILEGGVFDNGKIYCNDCGHQLGHCTTCRHIKICVFETDPSPVPKFINQAVKRGNVMSSFTVPNPSRAEITCKKGCRCWSEDFGCLRGVNNCDKWEN